MQAGIKYDFIGRFERVSEDVRVLGERIAPEFAACLPQEHHDATSAARNTVNYLTADLRDVIYRKFQLDFEFFGHPVSS